MYNLGSYGRHDSHLQVVSMQKRIVQDSSKGETTEKERKKYVHFTAWSILPIAYA